MGRQLAPHSTGGTTVKVTRFNAPVPVKHKTGRMPSELTVTLGRAIDDIRDTGASQKYEAESRDDADRVAVRIRQIASKKRVPLSVAVVLMDGKDVVIFGPREGVTSHDTDNNHADTVEEIASDLRELLARIEKMSR